MFRIILITTLIILVNINAQESKSDDMNTKISKMISQLTLEEKASLCSGRDD
jgi:hypothetical protein